MRGGQARRHSRHEAGAMTEAGPGLREAGLSALPMCPRMYTHTCVFKHEFSRVIMHAYEWALGTGEREFWRVHTRACA